MRMILVIGCLAAFAGLGAGCGPAGDREVRRGYRDLDRGEPVRARTRFEAAIRRRPGGADNAAIWNAAGVACWRMDDPASARAAFEESRRLDPSAMAPACNLGLLLAREGRTRDALVLLEEAALLDLGRTEALEALATIHGQAGQWEAAVRVLDEALSRQPDSPRILTALAYPLVQIGQPDAARKSLNRALEIDGEYAPALFNLAILQGIVLSDPARAADPASRFLKKNRRGEQAETIRALLKKWAETRSPEGPPPPRGEPPPEPRAAPGKEPPRPPSGEPASPLETAQREVSEGRTNEALEICLKEADEARLANDLARREKALQLALQFAFDRAEAHMACGRFLEERQNWASATRSYQKAALLDPSSVEAVLSLARVAVASGQARLARQTLEAAVEEHPKDADLRFQLARLYETVFQESEAAEAQYRKFLEANPQDPRADAVRRRLRLPVARAPDRAAAPIAPAWAEEPREPVRAAEPAVPAPVEKPRARVAPAAAPRPPAPNRKLTWEPAARKNPQAARQAIQRGIEHRERGDLERAEYYFLRAVENDERGVAAFQYLAEIYSQRGDHDLALDAYRKVIEFGADNSGNRYNLAMAHFARKEIPAALGELDLALRMNPQFPAALYLYGLILSDQPGRQAEARAYFSRYLSVAPPGDPLAVAVRDWLKNPDAGRTR